MRHPEWLKVHSTGTHETKRILRSHNVSTVCEEARCPNLGKCFSNDTATFMILGEICTRNCAFCAVSSGRPEPPESDEPSRVADAALSLGLKYVVITSVTRDDLPDGGAGQFAGTIRELKSRRPGVRVEVLTPDFAGHINSLKTVLDAGPDIFNHNIETVQRLYPVVRKGADYMLSLSILRSAKIIDPDIKTKSGIMLGLGEYEDEVISTMYDLRESGCEILTIGQYLQPRKDNLPVVEYISPDKFEQYRLKGLQMGFFAVESSPLTRSSMNAGEIFKKIGSRIEN